VTGEGEGEGRKLTAWQSSDEFTTEVRSRIPNTSTLAFQPLQLPSDQHPRRLEAFVVVNLHGLDAGKGE